ncbi:MAG: DHA2 family efflux MFS transporter permease subunit [Chloroflexi bacterium]|nr:DHA2 family efflux MFS transporter permease subunit [Chloroflexota bacterium]
MNKKWWALGALTLAVLAVGLDGTVLSVALPTLAGALHASESDLQWFFSGYLLVLAAAMLPAGLLGDRFGRKKIMLGSLALFGAGSAACAYAPSAGAFLAARVLLGLAGAGIVVMALSALTVLFTEEERPRAVGVWAAANFLALPVGPILGGWLVTNYWWGWVFVINVPVALVGFLAAAALVPESRAPQRPAIDVPGVVTSVAGLVSLTYGLIEAGQQGWGAPVAVAAMVLGLAVLVGFFVWESRATRPLVDLSLFRSAAFTWGVVLAAVGGLAMIGVLFTMPQYFQGVDGVNAMASGVRLLPLIGGLVLGAVPADRIAGKLGAKATVALGFVALALGLAIGALTSTTSSVAFVAGWMALVGLGMGLTLATAAACALSELPEERSGVGSAVMQAAQKVGGPFGSAILGSVLSAGYVGHLDLAGLPPAAASAVRSGIFGGLAVGRQLGSAGLTGSVRAAFLQGMDAALMVSAGIAIAGLVLTLAFLPGRRVARPAKQEAVLAA